jgi:Cu-Zn family superoxide dismutase
MGDGHLRGLEGALKGSVTMRNALLGPALLLSVWCCSGNPSPAPVESTIRTADGTAVGSVTLLPHGEEIQVHVRVAGMPQGDHGMHLHAVALCEPPAFQSAGAHLNPEGKQHGHLNPQGPHLGDLGNLTVGADGRADTTVNLMGAQAKAGLPGLLGPSGVALVIHADRDDERTDPAGSSGTRIACAAIKP